MPRRVAQHGSVSRRCGEDPQISSMGTQDRMQIARICVLIICLRLSFLGLEARLPLSESRQIVSKKQRRISVPTHTEDERSAPQTGACQERSQPYPAPDLTFHSRPDPVTSGPLPTRPQDISSTDVSSLDVGPKRSEGIPIQPPVRQVQPDLAQGKSIHGEYQFGDITISDHASAHLGDSYDTYNVAITNLYAQYDTLRIGMVAGTTAALMSQVLGAALACLKGHSMSNVPLSNEGAVVFIKQAAEDISFAVQDSWIQEYRSKNITPNQDSELLNHASDRATHFESKVELLQTVVPIIAVERAKKRPINEAHVSGPLLEVIDLLIKRGTTPHGFPPSMSIESALKYPVYYKKSWLAALTRSGHCAMAVLEWPRLQHCPVIRDFARHPDVCCIVLQEDHLDPRKNPSCAALIVFKARKLAQAAVEKWKNDCRDYERAWRSRIEIDERLRIDVRSLPGYRSTCYCLTLPGSESIHDSSAFHKIFFSDGNVPSMLSRRRSPPEALSSPEEFEISKHTAAQGYTVRNRRR